MRRIAAVSMIALLAAWPAMAQTADTRSDRSLTGSTGAPDRSLTGSTGAPPTDCGPGDRRVACDIAAVNESIARTQAPSPGSTVDGEVGAKASGGSVSGGGAPLIEPNPQSASGDRIDSRTRDEPLGSAQESNRLDAARTGSGLGRTTSSDTSTTGTASGSTRGISGSTLGASGGASGSAATPGGGRASGSSGSASGGSSGGGSGR